MTQIVPIQVDSHQGMTWRAPETFLFARQDSFSAVSLTEVSEAAASMPVVFIRRGEKFLLAALQGFNPGENLFVDDKGQWLGFHRPMGYSYYPFCLVDHEGMRLLCERSDSGLISSSEEGCALFDGSGDRTPELESLISELVQYQAALDRASQLTQEIVDLDLLVEWPIKFKNQEKTVTLTGLFRIDEKKLNSLPDTKYIELRESGALRICFSHLISMYNTKLLNHLHQLNSRIDKSAPDVIEFDSAGSLNFDNL